MIKNYYRYTNESKEGKQFFDYINDKLKFDENMTEFIPLDIRRQFDKNFDGNKYKGKDIDELYNKYFENLVSLDIKIKLIRDNIFDDNGDYLIYMRELLIGKRIIFTHPLDKLDYTTRVKRVVFGSHELLVIKGDSNFSKCLDEREPIIIKPISVNMNTELDPYGEEDWD